MRYAALVLICLAVGEDPGGGAAPSPDQQYQALAARYEDAFQAFVKANAEARTAEDWKRVDEHPGRNPRSFAPDFLALAQKYPGTSAAEDALIWICAHTFSTRECEEAKRRLIRDHLASAKLGPALGFQGHYTDAFEGTEAFFRRVFADSPHRDLRGLACYWLARQLLHRAAVVRLLEKNPDLYKNHLTERYAVYGTDCDERLRRQDPDALEREAEALFERVARYYADVPHNDKRRHPGPLGEAALAYLHERRDLAIGQPAPTFEGTDLDGRPFRLADYRGKVVVLDFGSHFYCGACRQTYPQMRDLAGRLKDRPFAIVSINAEPEKTLKELRDAWAAEKNGWRCLFDGTWEGPIQKAWNVQRFPTIFVLDGEGRIRFKNVRGPDLEAAVDGLLADGPR